MAKWWKYNKKWHCLYAEIDEETYIVGNNLGELKTKMERRAKNGRNNIFLPESGLSNCHCQ